MGCEHAARNRPLPTTAESLRIEVSEGDEAAQIFLRFPDGRGRRAYVEPREPGLRYPGSVDGGLARSAASPPLCRSAAMISKRARYALHGVGYLAYRSGEDAPVPFADILAYLRDYSRRLGLSPGYISKIFSDLSRAGLVQASVGRKGGYGLAKHPDLVSVADVVAAVDGWPVEQCCLLSVGGCNNQGDCGVFDVVNSAQTAFFDMLSGETAGSLARKMFRTKPPVGALADEPPPELGDELD